MKPITIERSVWVNADPQRVWQALSTPEQVARWLLPPALGAQLRLDDQQRLLVNLGGMEIPFAQIEVVEAPTRLVSRSLPDQVLATTYLLAAEHGGTRITVTTSGFEALPAAEREDRLEPLAYGWEKLLANLEATLANAELPFPEGYVAASLGFRRESAKRRAVERSIWIAAPRERVWQALVEPTQIEQWFSPGIKWTLTALEAGGRLFAPDPETGAERYTQVIEQIEPPQRLVMRTMAEAPDISYVSDYRLANERDGTRLTIIHSGYELAAPETRDGSMEQNAFGFGMMLANIKAAIEGQPLPTPGGF